MPRRSLMAAAVLLALAAEPVEAQIVVDPDSPSAKEYAIPLERARGEATGGAGREAARDGDGSRSSPLFGVGLSRRSSGADREGGGGGADGGNGGSAGGPGTDRREGGGSLGRSATAATPATPAAEDGNATLLTILVAVALLVLGTLGGLGFRRALGRSTE